MTAQPRAARSVDDLGVGGAPRLIGAPEPAPTWLPSPAQFSNICALIKTVMRASSVSVSFDVTDLVRTSGVERGFMGVPLVRNGEVVGALRVLDSAARVFTPSERAQLEGFAAVIMDQFELWQQASRDLLTGAMSRRAFINDLGKAIAAFRRMGDPCTLILFDLDRFKAINDTYGHTAGDAVLRAVADTVAAELRAYDCFGRLGGEEFGIVLNEPLPDALDVAERVRLGIERAAVPGYSQIRVTSSFGVVTCSPSAPTASAMLDAADVKLYESKQAGRNCVLWVDDPSAPVAGMR